MHDTARPPRVLRASARSHARAFAAALACAAATVATPASADAALLSGSLAPPTDFVPALTVHAWSRSERRLYSVGTAPGQATYVLDVPPGRYVVFATPADAGAPAVYGAHTRFSVCAREASRLAAGACGDHALLEIDAAKRRVDGVDVTDWSLDDAIVAELDAALGRASDAPDEAPLAAPRFSEYPAVRLASVPRAPALQADDGELRESDRDALARALAGAPTFAGRFAIVPVACDASAAKPCEGAAVVDLPLGRVTYPEALNPLPAAGPCTMRGVLQFRRDSRLLTITATDTDRLVTRYYVWDGENARLRSVATLAGEPRGGCTAPAVPGMPAVPAPSAAPSAPAAPAAPVTAAAPEPSSSGR